MGAPLARQDASASPTVCRFMSRLLCSGIKAPVNMTLVLSQRAVLDGAGR